MCGANLERCVLTQVNVSTMSIGSQDFWKNGGQRMIVSICGIPHEVIEREDVFDKEVVQFGQIDYRKAVITLNKNVSPEVKEESLWHEIMHGILVHLGYNEMSDNEQFIQAVSNGVYQAIKSMESK